MRKFTSFPEIGQYRQIVKTITERTRYVGKDDHGDAIYDHSKMMPIQKWTGTVKQHGTNAGVTINKDGEIWAQSRSNILSVVPTEMYKITFDDGSIGFFGIDSIIDGVDIHQLKEGDIIHI